MQTARTMQNRFRGGNAVSRSSMSALVRLRITLVLAGLLAGCASAPAPPPLPVADNGPLVHDIRVVSNGWHTAIVASRLAVLETGLLPEADDFPTAAVLEFGWGDRVYYPAREKTIGMTLAAAFAETPAVMHIAGLPDWPERLSAELRVISLALSDQGFRNMMGAIAADIQRPESGRAAPISPGLYGDSHFYHAHGAFHLFNTCNTWVARMLRAGRIDISPSGIMTAEDLVTRLEAALDKRSR